MIILNKSFSEQGEKKEKGKAGKIAAGVTTGTAAVGAAGYAGLKLAKKKLEGEYDKRVTTFKNKADRIDNFLETHVDGAKNTVRNTLDRKRGARVEAIANKMNEDLRRSGEAMWEAEDKLYKVDKVLNTPKRVIDKIKAAAKSPKAQAAGRKVKGTAVVLERKTRKLLRNAANDVRGLIKK